MKKFVVALLVIVLIFSLAACGKNNATKTNADAQKTTNSEPTTNTTQATTEAVVLNKPMLSTAYQRTSFINSKGDLYVWGNNEEYQLGLTNNIDKASPTFLASSVKKVVTLSSLTIFLKNDGRLYTCGYNEYGIAGYKTYRNTGSDGPKNILSDVIDFEHNGSTGAAINKNHELYMWGTHFSNTPVKVLDNVEKIVVDNGEMAIIKTNGDLYRWYHNHWYSDGRDNNYPICTTEVNNIESYKLTENAKDVFMDTNTTAILTQNKELYVHGWFFGIGNSENPDANPIKILDNVVTVDLNSQYLLALTDEGKVYIFGTSTHVNTPEDIHTVALVFENAKKIYASNEFYMIIDNNNTLYGLGAYNKDGVLSYDENSPDFDTKGEDFIELLQNVDYIQFLYDNRAVAAVTLDKSLYTWGSGFETPLGYTPESTHIRELQPTKILDNVSELLADGGAPHAIALCEDNSLYSWGYFNACGEIGNGTTEKQITPYKIEILV